MNTGRFAVKNIIDFYSRFPEIVDKLDPRGQSRIREGWSRNGVAFMHIFPVQGMSRFDLPPHLPTQFR